MKLIYSLILVISLPTWCFSQDDEAYLLQQELKEIEGTLQKIEMASSTMPEMNPQNLPESSGEIQNLENIYFRDSISNRAAAPKKRARDLETTKTKKAP